MITNTRLIVIDATHCITVPVGSYTQIQRQSIGSVSTMVLLLMHLDR